MLVSETPIAKTESEGSLFESSMFIFVFNWTPVLMKDGRFASPSFGEFFGWALGLRLRGLDYAGKQLRGRIRLDRHEHGIKRSTLNIPKPCVVSLNRTRTICLAWIVRVWAPKPCNGNFCRQAPEGPQKEKALQETSRNPSIIIIIIITSIIIAIIICYCYDFSYCHYG